jgi:hypothetical protein
MSCTKLMQISLTLPAYCGYFYLIENTLNKIQFCA